MGGWKTWLGGLIAVAAGIAGLAWGIMSKEVSVMLLSAGFAAMGVMGIGLGHKMEKAANGKK